MQDTIKKLGHLHAFLISSLVQFLLRSHPNDIATNPEADIIQGCCEWFFWCRENLDGWLEIVNYYMTACDRIVRESTLPGDLRNILDEVRGLLLDRLPISLEGDFPQIEETGMSPKKVHEVSRMVAYILQIIRINKWDPSVLRIVDVGAGQGYLTRSLKAQLPQTKILALDADEAQTSGAQRWERRLLPLPSNENPPITHKTIHVTPEALYSTIDTWITEESLEGIDAKQEMLPVLLVGLHACGSLTPDVIKVLGQRSSGKTQWRIASMVVVGCCYNLMNPGEKSPTIDLPVSAYHLAAQVPNHWLSSLSPPTPFPSVKLALRKVIWRALLGKKLRQNAPVNHPPVEINLTPGRQLPWSRLPTAKVHNFELNEEGTGATPEMRRLGRLKDTAYTDWKTFVDVAEKKMGIDFGEKLKVVDRDMRMERLLECFHTLRCLVGTVVESAIILDRLVWVDELVKSEGRSDLRTSVVNLFDQATGSGRNVAIVVAQKVPSSTEV
ncbi:hypothetical protein AGABI2DRAFT_186564, partial [Agaricus bisporus var. bisporus H97]|uniref:hypothetical protein n=1 Tax=Agaricus bisporus var. bisporus (strain H97 / ATCC MYA-4626 / FGSC 10389) TaxID=936046 RepID=UPI00029F79B9